MKDRRKLFLIDGMALIYRSYYALIKNPLTSSSGLNTSAIYGFINSLIKILKDEKPDYISIALDTKAKTFRHLKYNLYKANRKPMPDDLSEQLPYLYDIFNALNIKIHKMDGFEADDIIGTISKKISDKNIDLFMYSSDKDLMQLVNENTFLYSPGSSFKPTKIYRSDDVYKKHGVMPDQFIDYLALLGDTSDNIPGVKGIGSKTAVKLINNFKSIDQIYTLIDEINNPRIKNLLINNKENAFLSKDLITIDVNMDIDFNLEELNTKNLLFDNIIKKLHDLDILAFDRELFNKKDNDKNNNKSINKNYKVIDSYTEIDTLVKEIKNAKVVSIDLETTDINPNIAKIVGISMSYKKDSAIYIPILCPQKNMCFDLKRVLDMIKSILESDDLKFIGQNIKYDALILKRNNIDMHSIYFDTMIAESLISPEKNSYKLDYLSEDYLNYKMMPIDDLIGEKPNQITMKDVPIEDISYYACEDSDIALQIYEIQKKILVDKKLDKLFYAIEMPLVRVLVNMEYNGVYVDDFVIDQLCANLKKDLVGISQKIYSISNKEFNINSPQQLAVVLFDDLGLKMFKKRSTSVDVLKKLIEHHPIAEFILEYRHLNKLVNTYLDKLPIYINEKTGRIHTSFNQTVASTGRLSSTKPNFQNIPIKTDVGKSIRKAFKVQNDNCLIISFDYSQIELRILAHYSNEKHLIDAFNQNIDIHTRTASLIYGISNDEVQFNHRRVAKVINYSIAYGAGPYRISEELKISIKEASSIIDNYFNRYPGIKMYIENIIEKGRSEGFVETLGGRQRNTLNLNSSNRNIQEAEKRATINMPIQGTASELIKIAMIDIEETLKKGKYKSKMILQVHDELLFEVPKNEKDKIIKMVKNKMEGAMQLSVPIIVDCNFGENWYEAH